MQSFETPGKTKVIVYNPIDAIDVVADDTAATTVELLPRGADGADLASATTVTSAEVAGVSVVTVTLPGPRSISRRRSGLGVRITTPTGADVVVSTDGSERSLFSITRGHGADVRLHGSLGDVDVATVAGDVKAESVTGSLSVKTTSGDVTVEVVGGRLRARTVSGDVTVGEVRGDASLTVVSGDLTILTADRTLDLTSVSGDMEVSDAKLGATCKSTSGDVTIRRAWSGEVRAATVSGDVIVGVPTGRAVSVDARSMSGRLTSEIDLNEEPAAAAVGEVADEVRISANSVSGDVAILRAAAAAA